MLDQLFELSRKAAESSLQSQQAMFKHLTQDWASTSPISAGLSADLNGSMRKRWAELTMEALNKHRESLDATYRANIQMMEKLLRASEVKSSEDSVRAAEDVSRTLFETFKGQSEAHFRELQSWGERLLELTQKAGG
jgi:oligoendopeptidase F